MEWHFVCISKNHICLLRFHLMKEGPGELQEVAQKPKLPELMFKPLNHFPPFLAQFFPFRHWFSLAGAAGRAARL